MALLNELEILITAEEGYTALEEAVLAAKDRVDMGFRVFDPRTPLISDAARALGRTWVDLLVAKLDEGVRFNISISDFDPVVRAQLHRGSWKSFSVLAGIAELVARPNLLRATIADHPARVGWGPRMVLWPKMQSQIAQTCGTLNGLDPANRKEALRCMPRFRALAEDTDGELRPRKFGFPPMIPVTHHQKLAVIDDEVLYIGGLDLDWRRMDTPDHHGPSEETWHDVQLRLREPLLAASARRHLDRFLAECAGDCTVMPPEGLLRTLSVRREGEGRHLSPEVCDTGILDAHLEQISQAETLIYFESQFLRDPILAEALVARAAEMPDLGLVCVLPGSPMEVAFENASGLDQQYGEYLQAKCIGTLMKAFGERFFVATPAQKTEAEAADRAVLCGAPMIFVHSKVSIFDDKCALVTSANLNGRSMRWDTEMGLQVTHTEQVQAVRDRVMRAWLPEDAEPAYTAALPQTVDLWRRLAMTNAATAPQSRRGFLVPYDVRPAKSFGTPLPGVPVEMV